MSESLITADPNISPDIYPRGWFRFFEILPGAFVWTAILLPFLLSYIFPLGVTVFIIVFDIYWLIQAFNYGFVLIRGYLRMRHNLQVNWQASLDRLLQLSPEEREARGVIDWRDLYHVVIFPCYREEVETLEASLDSILRCGYPPERIWIVLATEGRDQENGRELARRITEKYGTVFFRFLHTEHPDGITGEVKGKGANATWAAKELVRQVRELKIPLDRIIVTTADADTRFDQRYFLALTFAYATLPNRVHCSFQPIATFFNNIWETSIFSRVLAFGDTFWTMIESVRSYRLITFSTHAVSLQTLVDINYWCTSIVNEDSRQYFRAYFHYKGDFRVVPLFIPIYMDAVSSDTLLGTLQSLYLQKQRWAYGVEHFPYIVMECYRQKTIPFLNRFMLVWRAFQGAFTWFTSSFFLSVVGWLPILLNSSFRDQVVVSNFVIVTNEILSLTWIGLIISSIITIRILAIIPHKRRVFDWFIMIIQWVLMPVSGILFSALPGLHAQTRLMLGKYLGFRVTQKSGHHPASEVKSAT
ncbi:glycosyltransferase family 2 protein [Patescibacteria group bacterium]|nr:glycosyltransferase family 2 protein [Patescibacteria group bacterium]